MLLKRFVVLPVLFAVTPVLLDLICRRGSPPLTKNASGDLNDLDLSGKRILITGGSNGVGFTAAKKIAERGGQVIITGRSKKTVNSALAKLPEGAKGMTLDFLTADFKSFRSDLSELLGRSGIDVILWNAGTAYNPNEQPYDVEFKGRSVDFLVATNHLGHFTLLQALLPDIKKWNTRNVFTSSISHQLGSAAYLPGPPSGQLHPFLQYGESKVRGGSARSERHEERSDEALQISRRGATMSERRADKDARTWKYDVQRRLFSLRSLLSLSFSSLTPARSTLTPS